MKEVLQLLHKDEEEGSSSKQEDTNSSDDDIDVFYQNEDDCFGIFLNDD